MERVKIGVIGAGWWATAIYLPLLKDDPRVSLAGVNRLGAEELMRVKDEFNALAAFEDYREMLGSTRFDGILVTSPHTLHFEHARAALEHGAHVLVEKPMTTDADDARALVNLARCMNRTILVPYGWNFSSLVARARDLIRDGQLGDIEHISLHMASPTGDLFSGEGLAEAKDNLFQPERSTWAEPGKAGGYGWGQLTHLLGMLFRITELVPVDVFAVTRPSKAGVDSYDAGIIRFENGAQAAISGAATVPKQLGFQIDMRIFGTLGVLLLDIERERLEVRRHDRNDVVVPLPAGAGSYVPAPAIETFVRLCCGEAVENPSPGIVGQRAVEVLQALYRSAETGRLVRT